MGRAHVWLQGPCLSVPLADVLVVVVAVGTAMSDAWNFAATIRRTERRPRRPPVFAGIRGLALILVALEGSRSRAIRNIYRYE